MQIKEVMTSNVKYCSKDDTLRRAAQLMWTHDIGALPVRAGDVSVGMITDRDIAMAAYHNDMPLSEIPVSQYMSSGIWCCSPNSSISDAEEEMRTHQVHRLPVLDDGALVGMVSLSDIARAVMTDGHKEDRFQVAATLGSITHPRSAQIAPGK